LHALELIEEIILYIFTAEYLTRVLIVWAVPARIANLIPEDHDKYEHEAHLQEVCTHAYTHTLSLSYTIAHTHTHTQTRTHSHTLSQPDPVYPALWQLWLYITEWKALIDFATIVPFYIFLGKDQSGGSASYNFIRVLRLSRILHVFKLTKDNEILHLLERTIRLSMPGLALVGFVTMLGMVLFGCLIYFTEGGDFKVTLDYPEGQFFRKDLLGLNDEVTPFQSIAISMCVVLFIHALACNCTHTHTH